MDQLRGPTIQLILHVKEGLGFGFLTAPFVVSGSLNGYMLETDPVVPCHAPMFDAELVWEADKRRFRSLRIHNVPIKVEVYTTGTQGRKHKVGYLLLSLLSAQPCPSSQINELKYSWHKLLGVRSEGKCCHPQLMMSLSVEDRVNTLTPRNELRMFHSNEVAYPSSHRSTNPPTGRSALMTVREYMAESKRTVSSSDLQPKLMCDEGLIQIGDGKQLFVLSFVIGVVENIDLLLPEQPKDAIDCYITYSIFTHDIMTDRVTANPSAGGCSAQFNQRTSLRLRTTLSSLAAYFNECPHVVTRLCSTDKDLGICSVDLRKLIPTEDMTEFVKAYCKEDKTLTIRERCFLLRCDEKVTPRAVAGRRPFVDVEMSLKCLEEKQDVVKKSQVLTARSVTQLESNQSRVRHELCVDVECTSGSCTHLSTGLPASGYTAAAVTNTARYKTATGAAMLQTNEFTDLIKMMYDSFADSKEKLLKRTCKPPTSDAQIQCETEDKKTNTQGMDNMQDNSEFNKTYRKSLQERERQENEQLNKVYGKNIDVDEKSTMTQEYDEFDKTYEKNFDSAPKYATSKSDTCVMNGGERGKPAYLRSDFTNIVTEADRKAIMQRIVEELEDWKEKQQEMYKFQLERKEEYHLELLAVEWNKKRAELEGKLSRGIEQCRALAADLSRATEDFRLRGYRNTERERKLLDAKKALESHYTAKYQELREASQKMEDDMNHKLHLKEMRIEELETKLRVTENELDILKKNIKNSEKEAANKYSGLTKEQTAHLIQELRCLEEKLDNALQSKAFFKEQWGRAVRELHLLKLSSRRQMLTTLRNERQQCGLGDTEPEIQLQNRLEDEMDFNKLKNDFYVDIMAASPVPVDSHSMISTSGLDVMDMYEEIKITSRKPGNDKLSELIAQRDSLFQQDGSNEELIKQLNTEIRTLLLNCGT